MLPWFRHRSMDPRTFQLERVRRVQVSFDLGMPLIRNAVLNRSIFSFNDIDRVRSRRNGDIPQAFSLLIHLRQVFDDFPFNLIPEAQFPHDSNDPRCAHADSNEVDLSVMLHRRVNLHGLLNHRGRNTTKGFFVNHIR